LRHYRDSSAEVNQRIIESTIRVLCLRLLCAYLPFRPHAIASATCGSSFVWSPLLATALSVFSVRSRFGLRQTTKVGLSVFGIFLSSMADGFDAHRVLYISTGLLSAYDSNAHLARKY
jgi:drug/metabolite transporter (DMT)-like permease